MYPFSQSHSRPGGVENLRTCTLAKAPLRKKFASPQRGVATFEFFNTSAVGAALVAHLGPSMCLTRCAFFKTPSVGMQLLEPIAFLRLNGDDHFSRKSPMRIWCKDFQYIFARAMFFR